MIQLADLQEHYAEARAQLAEVQADLDRAVGAARRLIASDRLVQLAEATLAARQAVGAIRENLAAHRDECQNDLDRAFFGLPEDASQEEIEATREQVERIALRLREPNEIRHLFLTVELQRFVREASTPPKTQGAQHKEPAYGYPNRRR